VRGRAGPGAGESAGWQRALQPGGPALGRRSPSCSRVLTCRLPPPPSAAAA
jgi:hypothetical protein